MAIRTKVATWRERDMVRAFKCGKTEPNMKASSGKTKFKVMESTSGQMAKGMKEDGKTVRWMARESTLGLMAGSTLANS